jgi:hypothetical protein
MVRLRWAKYLAAGDGPIMSACNEQVFNGITPARWECIRQAMQGRTGVSLATDTGTASKSGFTMRWNFDPLAQVLTVQCLEKPFIVPCSVIESTLTGIVNGCP